MPDKAIDVLDEAAARVRVKQGHRPSRQRELTKELMALNEKMEDAVAHEDYERAALYKQRITQMTEKLELEKEAAERKNAITAAMWRAIPEAVRWLCAEGEARVILMMGAGESDFSAGAGE